MAGFEASRTLQRRSSSVVSHSVDHPSGPLTRERGGLMSWPEHFYKQRRRPDLEDPDQQENNLSTRALQLSIFGSTMNNGRWHSRSFLRNRKPKPSHSQSYPRVPSNHIWPLASARSEGSTTMPKKFDVQKGKGVNLIPRPEDLPPKRSLERAESSDESSGEDELIVRIDSPSRLSFRQAS